MMVTAETSMRKNKLSTDYQVITSFLTGVHTDTESKNLIIDTSTFSTALEIKGTVDNSNKWICFYHTFESMINTYESNKDPGHDKFLRYVKEVVRIANKLGKPVGNAEYYD